MKTTMPPRILSLLVLGSLSLLAGKASASMLFNIDFGSNNAAPSPAFGASALQPGVWNQMIGAPLALVDVSGAATGVVISVPVADSFGGFGGSLAGDLGLLMSDNFFSSPGTPWSMTVSGLANGNYDFYYYAPTHPSVDTGAFTINGISAGNLTGSTTGSRTVEGLDWEKVANVPVTSGTLTTTWINAVPAQFTGLSGIQIVPTPEPGSLALLVLAGASLGLRRKRTVSV